MKNIIIFGLFSVFALGGCGGTDSNNPDTPNNAINTGLPSTEGDIAIVSYDLPEISLEKASEELTEGERNDPLRPGFQLKMVGAMTQSIEPKNQPKADCRGNTSAEVIFLKIDENSIYQFTRETGKEVNFENGKCQDFLRKTVRKSREETTLNFLRTGDNPRVFSDGSRLDIRHSLNQNEVVSRGEYLFQNHRNSNLVFSMRSGRYFLKYETQDFKWTIATRFQVIESSRNYPIQNLIPELRNIKFEDEIDIRNSCTSCDMSGILN